MACGACEPAAFREGDGVVYGYLVARTEDAAARDARKHYYMGAECVFADEPKGQVGLRSGYSKLSKKFLRRGDKLILATERALGTHPRLAERHIAALEAQGVRVAILRPEYFEEEGP